MRLPARRRSRVLLAGALVVLVAVASTGTWLLVRDSSEAADRSTATVTTQTVRETVTADGALAARTTSDEAFAVSGTVTRVAVVEGDKVAKGDVLAAVDDEGLVAQRTAAKSSLDAAESQLDEDQDNGASDVQVAADKTAVVSAQATYDDARQAVEDATLRASIAGTVTSVGIERGDTVGSTASPDATGDDAATTATISILATGRYDVVATVAADDVDRLKKGLQVEIAVTGVTETVYGTVSEVGLVAQANDSGAAVFPVTIEVTGRRKDLFAGVSATATIVVKQRDGVLTVPSGALTTEDGTTYATVVDGDEETKVEVEIGEAYGMDTEVLAGLEEGDTVLLPTLRLTDGGDGPQDGELTFPGGDMPQFGTNGGGPGGPTVVEKP
ncbi:efflux RND transporter periplasmic adaptor subunit [Nocardioides sp. CGMCC 1.13656]|uniref:efflux RND transporter periplasmic adaptor subunit n=1 Tax=Nocardioides TaxID=1839 RepID=UPI0012FAB9B1|nr:efflux RND transporter periplasmic adaptor subunit [Nocardioides sp. CGMCC 1.13656]MBA2952224.1 efflux RND transporter periplasmic adaptor subunit [Nocardioides sp. CGMCC 1.13656]